MKAIPRSEEGADDRKSTSDNQKCGLGFRTATDLIKIFDPAGSVTA